MSELHSGHSIDFILHLLGLLPGKGRELAILGDVLAEGPVGVPCAPLRPWAVGEGQVD